MKIHLLPLLSIFALCACSSHKDGSSTYDYSPQAELKATDKAPQKSLSISVFNRLASESKDNIVFSPASLEGALRTLKQGARGNTATLLNIVPDTKSGASPTMKVEEANAVFLSENIRLKAGIKANDIKTLPFGSNEACDAISDWVREKTHGFIEDYISPAAANPNTKMLIVNAVHLKEKWNVPFDSQNTRSETFIDSNGKKHRVQMMHKTEVLQYAKGKNWQAIALPYKSGGYFVAILPNGNAHRFAATLTPTNYHAIIQALASGNKEIELGLPNFDIETDAVSLKQALQQCGLSQVFSPQANFSGFCDTPLFADDVTQKCRIKLDEDGTEAAALSEIPMWLCEEESPLPLKLTFNRPFIWIITEADTANTPYFMGIMETP